MSHPTVVAFDADREGRVARLRCVTCKAVWRVEETPPARCGDRVVDLMAALEQSIADAKAARGRRKQDASAEAPR